MDPLSVEIVLAVVVVVLLLAAWVVVRRDTSETVEDVEARRSRSPSDSFPPQV